MSKTRHEVVKETKRLRKLKKKTKGKVPVKIARTWYANKIESWCGRIERMEKLARRIEKLRKPLLVIYAALVVSALAATIQQVVAPVISMTLFVGWATLVVAGTLFTYAAYFVEARLWLDYATNLRKFYLVKFSLFDIFDKRLFNRLYVYTQCGFCYEAAALNMLAMKDNPTARYVISASKKDGQHAFVEFRAGGLWWVLDPNWRYQIIELRALHHLHLGFRKPLRVISHEEFFAFPVVQEFEQALSNPETSLLFNELLYFHARKEGVIELNFEECRIPHLINDGRLWDHTMDCAMNENAPVTHKVIVEYMLNPRRLMPRRQTHRRAMVLQGTIWRLIHELEERKDAAKAAGMPCPRFQAFLTGLKTYRIEEIPLEEAS